jgi:hypothetical protein
MTAGVTGPEHNKQLVRRIVEEMFNLGRLEVAHEIFGPDFVDRGHESMADKKGWTRRLRTFCESCSRSFARHKRDHPDYSRGRRLRCYVEHSDRYSSRGTVWNGSIGETN